MSKSNVLSMKPGCFNAEPATSVGKTIPTSGPTSDKILVALAGNPNCGKTTIFNALTDSHQHIGNYPGVTVEKKEGTCRYQEHQITLVDLPGIYSLTAASTDELAAHHFLMAEKPDVVVNIIDTSTMEHGFFLTTQLLEMAIPLVVVLNMTDVTEKKGITIDYRKLETLLGVPVIPAVARKKVGKKALLEAIATASTDRLSNRCHAPHYNHHLEKEIAELLPRLTGKTPYDLPPRWLAVKLLEEDPRIIELVNNFCPTGTLIVNSAARAVKRLTTTLRRTPALAIIENRYGFISSICRQVVSASITRRVSISDKIDLVLTNRLLGLPLFFLLMYLVFSLTFSFGSRPSGWISSMIHQLGAMINMTMTDGPLQSLLVNGIMAGVGNVLAFMPSIFILFLAIAILEDTGYLARVAFLMDRIMRSIGLSGKSFIPMMIGMGCSVPAIMATRILENEDERLTTIMVIPLMSCSARLPIYALIIPAFFPLQWQAPMLWMVYLTGIGLMMLSARFIRRHLRPENGSSLVMELPPYRLPTLEGVFFHMWGRSRLYLKKAATIIFALSIVFWALTNYPKAPENYLQQFSNPEIRREAALSYSTAGRLGHALEPLIRPLGFDWRIGTALLGACAAKEIFIAQLGIIFAVEEKTTTDLGDELRRRYTPLTGLCIILFNLISLPCLATLAATRQETNSWRWPLLQLSGLTLLAWLITFITYQTGLMLTGIIA